MTEYSTPEADRSTIPIGKRMGLLETAVQKLITRPARVITIEDLGEKFRMVTLGGDTLKGVEWTPGDKIQLQFGGWVQRTYTPLDWNPMQGRTRILIYMHGDGPGSQWARCLRTGDACQLFGPRQSIDLNKLQSSAFVFGDESSLGLVAALDSVTPGPIRVQTSLEISVSNGTLAVIKALFLNKAHITVRTENDAHLSEVEARALGLLQANLATSFVLTGKATSVQRIRQFLRQHRGAASQFQNKAYWAPGKKGLD